MPKLKQFLRWFLCIGFMALGLYAMFTKNEEHWREMYAVSCFLLSMNNAFDGGNGE